MTNAFAVYESLRAAGFVLRAAPGKLFVRPADKLSPEQSAAIQAHKPALIDLLIDLDARADAIAAIGPPDFDATGPLILESYTLLKVSEAGRPPEYIAVDPVWLDHQAEYSAARKREIVQKKERAKKRQKNPSQRSLR